MANSTTYYISSHVGSLTSQGKDFNIFSTNASFELFSKLDKALRNGVSQTVGENTNSSSTENAMSEKVANSLIVCAPQIKDTSKTITYIQTLSYQDNSNDGYTDDDYVLETNSEVYVNGVLNGSLDDNTTNSYKDSGQFDLVVTDSYGVPSVITPPFNDIDTSYFNVLPYSELPETRYRKYSSTYALTLSENFQNTIGSASEYIKNVPYSYTSIVPDNDLNKTFYLMIKNTTGENKNQRQYYVGNFDHNNNGKLAYEITTSDGKKNGSYIFIDGTTSLNPNDTTYTIVEATFSYVLDKCVDLLKWRENQFNKVESNVPKLNNEEFENKSITYKLAYLLNAVNDLNNRPYEYSLNKVINKNKNSYIWTGTKSEYDNNIKNNSRYTDYIPNTSFIIQK